MESRSVKKGICSFVGTESARVLHFDLDLSDSPFTCIIIRRYRRILKEVEDIVPALDETFLELSELLSHVFKVFRQQPIKPYQPRLLVDDGLRVLVALVDGLLQQTFYLLGPFLLCVPGS